MIISKLIKYRNGFIAPLPKNIVKELNIKANQEVLFDIFPKNKLRKTK